MTQTTEDKALAMVNAIRAERNTDHLTVINRKDVSTHEALCRVIEQREAYKHKVSDALLEGDAQTILYLLGVRHGREDERAKIAAENSQPTQSDALREALRNIQIEAEREKGSWVHLKRVIALNCKAALQEQSK